MIIVNYLYHSAIMVPGSWLNKLYLTTSDHSKSMTVTYIKAKDIFLNLYTVAHTVSEFLAVHCTRYTDDLLVQTTMHTFVWENIWDGCYIRCGNCRYTKVTSYS